MLPSLSILLLLTFLQTSRFTTSNSPMPPSPSSAQAASASSNYELARWCRILIPAIIGSLFLIVMLLIAGVWIDDRVRRFGKSKIMKDQDLDIGDWINNPNPNRSLTL